MKKIINVPCLPSIKAQLSGSIQCNAFNYTVCTFLYSCAATRHCIFHRSICCIKISPEYDLEFISHNNFETRLKRQSHRILWIIIKSSRIDFFRQNFSKQMFESCTLKNNISRSFYLGIYRIGFYHMKSFSCFILTFNYANTWGKINYFSVFSC